MEIISAYYVNLMVDNETSRQQSRGWHKEGERKDGNMSEKFFGSKKLFRKTKVKH